ncbi:MAG TPA: hypothetical protein VFZ24_00695 [Longimicrobiales bacterium]
MSSTPPDLFTELKRRRVFRVAAVYAAIAWLIIQISATAFPYLALPAWTITLVIVLLIAGLPIALVLSWAYEVTPEGVRRTEPPADAAPRRRGTLATVLVVLAAVVLGTYMYRLRTPPALAAGDGRTEAIRSIAVLPFVNMSADADNEYFSDGLTEELLNTLAQVEDLRVAARTSAFAFKGVNRPVTEIGRTLNVETVLEGSVRKTGSQLRITAQLINVADGYHIWSKIYDRQLADIFTIQQEISHEIVANLLPRFGGRTPEGHGSTTDVQAYEEYLKGRFAFWQGTSETNLRTAIRHYEAAIERDPGYALAYAGLSDAYMLLGGQHAVPVEVFPRAKEAALRALELDDQLAEGYVALASINWFYEWDWPAAERNYRRSFSVNRTVYTRCICYVWYLVTIGDLDAAVREGERVRMLDPVGHLPLTTLAQMYFLAGRPADARATLDALEEAGSTSALIPRLRAWLLWDEGDRDGAVAVLDAYATALNERGGFARTAPPIAVAELAYMYANRDRVREAQGLAEELRARAETRYVPGEYVAAAFAAAGDTAEVAAWLQRAYSERSNLGMFSTYPLSRALAGVPAYQDVLGRVGVPRPVHGVVADD